MATRLAKYAKAPDERKDYSIDYSKWLESGETVTAVEFTITAEGFVTPAVTPLLVDAYLINGTSNGVSFFATQGDDGETYKVIVKATTSIGQVKEDLVVFVVRAL